MVGTLYAQNNSFRTKQVLVAAKFGGVEVKVAGPKAPVDQFPLGVLPAYHSDDVTLFGESAIALHLSGSAFQGIGKCSEVLQWISFGENKLVPTVLNYVLPSVSVAKVSADVLAAAKNEFNQTLAGLNDYLLTRTFLVGESLSLADVMVALDLLPAFEHVLDNAARSRYQNLTRYFNTVINQEKVKAVVGNVKLATKEASFDPENFKKNSDKASHGHEQKPAKHGKAKEDKPKEAKPAKAEAKPAAPQPEEIPAEPKAVDPFAAMPAGTFVMDEFKRVYSNEDTATKAIPWFWEHFDKDNYSIWYGEYKYPEDLALSFMSCNLITGMFQRLDRMRKHAFGSVLLFGTDNNSTISGIWVWKGHDLAFDLSPDLQIDSESYLWKKLDASDEGVKKQVNEYLLWEGDFDGKKFNQGKIFK